MREGPGTGPEADARGQTETLVRAVALRRVATAHKNKTHRLPPGGFVTRSSWGHFLIYESNTGLSSKSVKNIGCFTTGFFPLSACRRWFIGLGQAAAADLVEGGGELPSGMGSCQFREFVKTLSATIHGLSKCISRSTITARAQTQAAISSFRKTNALDLTCSRPGVRGKDSRK